MYRRDAPWLTYMSETCAKNIAQKLGWKVVLFMYLPSAHAQIPQLLQLPGDEKLLISHDCASVLGPPGASAVHQRSQNRTLTP